MIQARLVDIHRYYRTDGVDWVKLKAHCDAVIISAGVGMALNPLLKEQVDGAVDHAIPYMTYHIPSPNFQMRIQVENYLSGYGVKDAWTCVDVESPNPKLLRCINATELFIYADYLTKLTKRKPLMYLNLKALDEVLFWAARLAEFKLWIAQWPWRLWKISSYTDFDSFLSKYAGLCPGTTRNTFLQANTILWQFTRKGNARLICANLHTADPAYPLGVQEADLNVSTIDKADLLSLMANIPLPPPPPPPPGDWYSIPVSARNIRQTPNAITGKIIITLGLNDRVLVRAKAAGSLGEWGLVGAYQKQGILAQLEGWVYMGSLVKIQS
jgi:GH25 family lysozyme M1 (1,4-beta-N-acetylmuramidase)